MSHHASYDRIDHRHPFHSFLNDLPTCPECDPRPDFIERGTSLRWFIAFSSVNGNARLNYFEQLVKSRNPEISIMTKSYYGHTARCVIYLRTVRRLGEKGEILKIPAPEESPTYIAGRPEGDLPPVQVEPPVEVELPGVTQMPSYS